MDPQQPSESPEPNPPQQPAPQQPPPGHTPAPGQAPAPGQPQGPPLLTKAVGSMICGMLSIPACCGFGIPALILGGVAIWLGVWVQKNFRGSTASEFANLWAWFGIILGSIGIVLGIIALIMIVLGSFGAAMEEFSGGSSGGAYQR